ncbi:MAG: hypothetical protein HQM13_22930 [SAR324 cluster bacterium]|nr:hypothetical protein [SAR324 cluster bacterium]
MKASFFLLIFTILILGAGISACSYQLEGTNPRLPSGANTLAIIPIQNQTFQAGLETRLIRQLRQLLRNNSSVNLSSLQEADLILEIRLKSLNTKQTSVSADGSTVALQLALEGSVTLNDRKSNKELWRERELNARGVLLYEKGETSKGLTGSTIGRGLDEVTNEFAKRIYERIFFSF